MLDYHADRTWASVKLEFDNDMGIESGTTSKLALERAYFGGRLIAGDTFTCDAELGRRNLNNVFDSKIEFSSLFDGGLLRFNKASEAVGDFYVNIGGLIVNDRFEHFAGIGEMGLLRIGNTGFYTKFSYIYWKKDYSDPLRDLYFNYRVSQLSAGYQCVLTNWKKFLKIYMAGLYNDAAKGIPLTDNEKLPYGAYVGFSLGQVRKAGDWAIDFNLQYVQAQAIPDYDVGGIKRGNAAGVGLYTTKLNGEGDATTRETAVGSCNYKGISFEWLYAFTDNLTMQQSFQISDNVDKSLGPKMNYKQYEIEFIYAF